MSLKDWLSGFLGDFKFADVIKIFSDIKIEKKVYQDNRAIYINTVALEEKDQETLKRLLPKYFEEEGALFVEEKSDKTLQEISEISPSQDLLIFFRGKIPQKDLKILEASLYLKALQDRGETAKVGPLRVGLIEEYGKRANNISKLCTAGYFETIIRPLYEEMAERENFSEDIFRKNYEIIVEDYPFAFFVHSAMNETEIKSKIIAKIEKIRNYGLGYIRVHGIGRGNVTKIRHIINDEKITCLISGNPEIESGDKYIIVQLNFTRD